ncbi:MAG TPA: AI-2E family transporter [Chloroflexota bacterium]|nr:AI-2E family transporter [Chloroflexota bacterium]
MIRIDWTRLLIIQLSLLASILLLGVVWIALSAIAHSLLLFVLATLVAFMLAPLVTLAEERGLPRPLAVSGVYLGVALALLAAGALLIRPFLTQAALFLENVPDYITRIYGYLLVIDQWLEGLGIGGGLATLQSEATRRLTTESTLILGDLVRFLTHVANSVVDAVLVLVISFYLLLDGPRLRQGLLALVPKAHQSKVAFLEEHLVRVVGGYLRGQLTLALSLGLVVGVGLQLLGMPYAVVLGVIAGLFELVPMFGAVLGALPALAIALLQPFPMVLWVLLFFVVVQQIENHVLVPRISGHAVGLHPLGAMFALLAGFELGGVLGAIFAVPVAGFLWVVAITLYRRLMGLEDTGPGRRAPVPSRAPAAAPPPGAQPSQNTPDEAPPSTASPEPPLHSARPHATDPP